MLDLSEAFSLEYYLVCYYCFTLNKRNIVIYKLMNYCVAFINDNNQKEPY